MGRQKSILAESGRFDSLEQEVFLNLWRTYDRLRILEDELFQSFELSPQQYNVLRLLELDWLRRRPTGVVVGGEANPTRGIPTLELAGRLVSRAPDITRMLDRLESRGLIERFRSPRNRRVVEVCITDRGRKLVAQISGPLEACHRRQLGHLTRRQLLELSSMLQSAREPHEHPESPWRPLPSAQRKVRRVSLS